MNLVEAEVINEKDKVEIKIGKMTFIFPEEKADRAKNYIGKKVWFGIRPKHIQPYETNPNEENDYAIGKISVIEQMGNEEFIYFHMNGEQYISRLNPGKVKQIALGEDYKFWFDMSKCHLFDFESEENISL